MPITKADFFFHKIEVIKVLGVAPTYGRYSIDNLIYSTFGLLVKFEEFFSHFIYMFVKGSASWIQSLLME